MPDKETGISSNVVWRLLERFGAKIVTFIVSIILARLLEPAVYGTVALVTVFTSILEVFIDSGLGSALIQKKDADDLDFSSVFYFNVVMCIVLYLGMYVAAPYIALFYKIPELTPIVRVMSMSLIISGVKNIQYAYISRNMMFKFFFWATLFGTIVSAFVGIFMAYKGYGVWAIVIQPLVNYTIDTIVLWYTVKWRPLFQFSLARLRSLLSFGWKILIAKLINTTYNKARDLIIGKLYSSSDLAFYNRGNSFPYMIVPNITTSIDGVIFPAMAKVQNDKSKVRELLKKSIHISYMVGEIFSAALCAWPCKKLVDYSLLRQLKDLLPLMISCVVMAIIVGMVQLLNLPDILTLIIQVVLGVVVYLILSKIFKLEGYTYFVNKMRNIIHKKNVSHD